jgi:cobalamin synthase
LVSLGAGVVIFVMASFVVLFTWKLLNSPEWMTILLVWVIAWPLLLLVKIIHIPYPGEGAIVLAVVISITIDVAILAGLIYAALSLLNRRALPESPPPPPVPFQ